MTVQPSLGDQHECDCNQEEGPQLNEDSKGNFETSLAIYTPKLSDEQEIDEIQNGWLLPAQSPEFKQSSHSVPIGLVSPNTLDIQRLASYSSGFRVLPSEENKDSIMIEVFVNEQGRQVLKELEHQQEQVLKIQSKDMI